jgi:hypothetical protein
LSENARSTTEQGPHELQPADLPDRYASIATGDCLEPIFSDGACLVFSKSEPVEAGDFVGIWLKPEILKEGELQRRVKRLLFGIWPGMTFPFTLSEHDGVEPIVVLEMLNPPKMLQVRASHILAMHKVVGEAKTNGDGTAQMIQKVDHLHRIAKDVSRGG